MQEVRLRFTGVGYRDICQSKVCIYDCNNNLVYEGLTYNGEIVLYLRSCCIYKVVACLFGEKLIGAFYTSRMRNIYVFNFASSIARPIEREAVTFLLTDYYYENLPIERGEMTLWQR